MQKKKAVSILISVAVSIILIWILLSQIEIGDFVQTFAQIYVPALLAFMAISLAAATLRSWRYKWLLHPQHIGWGNIFLVTFIRNLFVDLFPARIGSLSYIYILNRKLNYSFEVATSTFVVAFVFDFLTLSPFLVISILSVGLGSTTLSSTSLLGISLLFLLIICLILLKITQLSHLFLNVLQLLLKLLNLKDRRWAKITVEKISLTIAELIKIKKRKIYWPLFFLSLGIRLAKYGSLYILLFSLLRSHGFSLENLSFPKTILGITGAELTSALPIKGIGGFGTWESAWALTLMLLGFKSQIAILSSGVHLITNLFEYFLGILSILILALPFIKSKRQKSVS